MVENPSPDDPDEMREMRFLLEEGLQLLAAYRRIPDPATRRALLDLIERVADGENFDALDGPFDA